MEKKEANKLTPAGFVYMKPEHITTQVKHLTEYQVDFIQEKLV